jgi:hypothetical protein
MNRPCGGHEPADHGSGGNTSPPQNHRGFGFVIFHDAHAIDELLGSGPSRVIILHRGAKLEVTRASDHIGNLVGGPHVDPTH